MPLLKEESEELLNASFLRASTKSSIKPVGKPKIDTNQFNPRNFEVNGAGDTKIGLGKNCCNCHCVYDGPQQEDACCVMGSEKVERSESEDKEREHGSVLEATGLLNNSYDFLNEQSSHDCNQAAGRDLLSDDFLICLDN